MPALVPRLTTVAVRVLGLACGLHRHDRQDEGRCKSDRRKAEQADSESDHGTDSLGGVE